MPISVLRRASGPPRGERRRATGIQWMANVRYISCSQACNDMRHTIGFHERQFEGTIATMANAQGDTRYPNPVGHAGERLRFSRLFPPCRGSHGVMCPQLDGHGGNNPRTTTTCGTPSAQDRRTIAPGRADPAFSIIYIGTTGTAAQQRQPGQLSGIPLARFSRESASQSAPKGSRISLIN